VKVRIFRQRISQVHESETEINDWLEETEGSIEIKKYRAICIYDR
jgi:hypothetical protein